MKVEVDEEYIETTSPKGTQYLGGDLAVWGLFPDDVRKFIFQFLVSVPVEKTGLINYRKLNNTIVFCECI